MIFQQYAEIENLMKMNSRRTLLRQCVLKMSGFYLGQVLLAALEEAQWTRHGKNSAPKKTILKHGSRMKISSQTQMRKINIEKLIDKLEIACLEWKRQNSEKLNDLLKSKSTIYRHVIKASVLQDDLWVDSELHESSNKLNSHRKMLAKLVSNRQPGQASPWIFTTNYDLAMEWSAEALELNVINGFSGTHCRKFTPNSFDLGYRNIRTRGEAQFGAYNVYLAKLHGSLTWELGSNGNVVEWQSIIQKEKIKQIL